MTTEVKLPDLQPHDHPDFVGGMVWTEMEIRAIRRYAQAALRADAQALAGEVERLRARLAFLTDPEALRFVEKDSGLYRVYEDKASPENALHFWQSMTYLFYPTAEEAIDAALDASRALATQEAM